MSLPLGARPWISSDIDLELGAVAKITRAPLPQFLCPTHRLLSMYRFAPGLHPESQPSCERERLAPAEVCPGLLDRIRLAGD